MPGDNAELMPSQTKSLTEVAVFIPSLATAVAITYNVGYFTGLDIKLFTLFSFSEHIVFALEAIPFALLMACGIVAFVIIGKYEKARAKQYDKRENSRTTKWFVGIASLLLFALSYYSASIGTYGVAALIVCTAIAIFCSVLFGGPYNEKVVQYLWAAISALIISFTFGIEKLQADLSSTGRHTLSIADTVITGSVIRSGERGLLFHQSNTKQLSFIKWDQIKEVRLNLGDR